jgi:hypothetical protein
MSSTTAPLRMRFVGHRWRSCAQRSALRREQNLRLPSGSDHGICATPSVLLKLAFVLTRIKRFIFVLFLLVFPLQGLAAAVAPVLCLGGGGHHDATHAGTTTQAQGSQDHDSHDHGSHAYKHANSDTSPTGETAGHMECHHVFSGVAMSFPPIAPPTLPIFQATISPAATLYIPELPQRPPRT